MQGRTVVLLVGAVVIGVMLFAPTELIATGGGEGGVSPPVDGLVAPASCTAQLGSSKQVQVDTGIISGDISVPFPQDVFCSGDSGPLCSRFDYKFTYTGGNPAHSFVSVSSDLDILSCNPTCKIENNAGAGDTSTSAKVGKYIWEQRTVRFNSNLSTLYAYVITEKAAPRVSSAGGHAGTQVNLCLIQGPGGPVDPFKPQPATQNVVCAGGKCVCQLTFDRFGNLQSVTTEEPCTASSVSVCVTLGSSETCEPVQNFETITSGTGTCTTYPTRPLATTVCR
jgi:hypothetical protein